MSNIYIKEPSTIGKVLMNTSLGEIDIELWPKEAPLACRNFVQLCYEGYYNNIIFHRVVHNFIVQGGDPTGTGEGGQSIYDKPFKDEFHSRLRFVRRGLVAMANAGPNDNGSQFFFTLGPCNDLNKKHTIFGKVTGDTIYNLVRLGEVGTTDDERPINPPFIKWTKVLANPFDDIEPRVTQESLDKKERTKKKNKSQMKATKDFKLLSFGEEAEEEEIDNTNFDASHTVKSKSSHDLSNDPTLSSKPAILESSPGKCNHEVSSCSDKEENTNLSTDEESKGEQMQRIKDKLQAYSSGKKKTIKTSLKELHGMDARINTNEDLRKQSKQLARDIIKSRKLKDNTTGSKKQGNSDHSDISGDENNSNPMYADFKMQQKKYREQSTKTKDKGGSRETSTLEMLSNFKNKLFSVRKEAGWEDDNHDGKHSPLEEFDEDDVDDDVDSSSWLLHRLRNNSELRDAKDMNREVNEDRFDISDPRNPLNKRRREISSKKNNNSRNQSPVYKKQRR